MPRTGDECGGWVRQRTRRSIVCPQGSVQIKIGCGLTMVKALRRWLEANELFPSIDGRGRAGCSCCRMVLVFGGYLIVTR